MQPLVSLPFVKDDSLRKLKRSINEEENTPRKKSKTARGNADHASLADGRYGSRLASVGTHEQTGSYMSPQSARASFPSKDQGRPPVHPSKKARNNASLDTDAEIFDAWVDPYPWVYRYGHSSGNTNPVASQESISPVRSPDAGIEMDLDPSAKEQESNVSPRQQRRYLPPLLVPLQPQVSPPPQHTQNQRAETPPKPQATSALPTGSNSHTWTEDEKNLIEQLRSHMSKDPGYDDFLGSRNKQLTMREQLKYYTYIAKQLGEYTCRETNAKKVGIGFPNSCESSSFCLVADACDGRFQFTGIVGGYGAGDPSAVCALRS